MFEGSAGISLRVDFRRFSPFYRPFVRPHLPPLNYGATRTTVAGCSTARTYALYKPDNS